MNLEIDLVIFDCDGVLVDSEVISCRLHAEVLMRYGYTAALCALAGFPRFPPILSRCGLKIERPEGFKNPFEDPDL